MVSSRSFVSSFIRSFAIYCFRILRKRHTSSILNNSNTVIGKSFVGIANEPLQDVSRRRFRSRPIFKADFAYLYCSVFSTVLDVYVANSRSFFQRRCYRCERRTSRKRIARPVRGDKSMHLLLFFFIFLSLLVCRD